MAFTPPGNMQWVTLWKPSHYLCQSPFPSQRKARWRCGARGISWLIARQLESKGHNSFTLDYIRATTGLLVCLALCFPVQMDFVSWVHPPHVSIPRCFMLARHTMLCMAVSWMAHRKQSQETPGRNSVMAYNKLPCAQSCFLVPQLGP